MHPCHIICRCPLNKLHFPMSGKFCDCCCMFCNILANPTDEENVSPGCADSGLMRSHMVFNHPRWATYISKHLCLHVLSTYYYILPTPTTYTVYNIYEHRPKLRVTKAIVSKSYRSRSLAKSTYMVLEHVKQWLLIWRCISIHLHRINNTGT